MKVLSLFDGMSVAQQALKNIGANVEVYYASEIDEYAIATTQANHPLTKQVGSVVGLSGFEWVSVGIDLLIGGSPCQDLSIAKKNREGLKGQRSGLFFEYVRIRDEVKPKYFILENVASMPKEAKEQISEILGVEPVMINASLVSAQNRKRLFWVGKLQEDGTYKQVEIPQPEDRGILLKDILESGDSDRLKSYCIDANYFKGGSVKNYLEKSRRQLVLKQSESRLYRIGSLNSGGQGDRIYSQDGKSVSLSANGGGRGGQTGLYAVPVALRNRGDGKKPEYNGTDKANAMTSVQTDSMVEVNTQIRKLTPTECLRLQSMPDNYFDKAEYKGKPISNTQRYKMCGNAFNCAVIEHILKHICA
jgi:DNA-cytosine methyltransferase